MQLDKWLKKEGHTRVWLERKLKTKPRRIETILNGANITLEEAIAIESITLGKVTQKDWLERARKHRIRIVK